MKTGCRFSYFFTFLQLLAALVFIPHPAGAAEEGLVVGKHVPPLTLISLDGAAHNLDWPLDDGETTLFFFFSFLSAPSLHEMASLDKIYRQASGLGLQAFAIESSGRPAVEVIKSLAKYQTFYSRPPYPIIADEHNRLSTIFGIESIPTTILIEKHGVVLFRKEGFVEGDEGFLARKVEGSLRLHEGSVAGGPSEGDDGREIVEEGRDGEHPRLFVGDQAPSFSVTDLEGNNRPVGWADKEVPATVIFFWGDPCSSCIQEMVYLDQVYRNLNSLGRRLRVLAVTSGGLDAGGTARVMDKLRRVYEPPLFPVVPDPYDEIARLFGSGPIPRTYFIDEMGAVIDYVEGFSREMEDRWTEIFEAVYHLQRGELGRLLE